MSDDEGPRPGRKRDPARDGLILDAALAVLAEVGYAGTTIDTVAARAGAARATVYRRWATKADLVLAAIERMSRLDLDLDELPDTGTLRGDMVGLTRPYSARELELRTRVLAALTTLSRTEPRIAAAATDAGVGRWVEANRVLVARAVDRGEFPAVPASTVATLAQVIPTMSLARAVADQPIDPAFTMALVDDVVIPALRGGAPGRA